MEEYQDYITDETLPGEAQDVPSSDGVAAESPVVEPEAITLAEIEKTLGKKFPNKEAALKSWKDTYSYVGTKTPKEATVQASDPVLAQLNAVQEQLKVTQFYNDNPEFNTYEAKELIAELGGNPETVVNTKAFQLAFKSIQSTNDEGSSKSVLHSNSRVAAVSSDYQQDFEKAQASGNWAEFMAKHKGVEIPKF
jgi:hypothetical protein